MDAFNRYEKVRGGVMFVCFAGMDGSGKTTVAKALVERVRTWGVDVEYTWCKFESRLFMFLIWLKDVFVVREQDWRKNFERSRMIKSSLFRNRLAQFLYESYLLIAYWFQITFKVGIPLLLRRTCIVDRYVYDTFVDLAVDLDYSDRKMIQKIERYMRFVPRPDLIFLFSVPVATALERKGDIPSTEFWKQKSKKYEHLADTVGVITLNGALRVDELLDQIEGYVLERMRR